MTRFADDYVKFRAASQRYGSKVHALGASAPPRARSSPHEGRIIPKRSRRSHGWRTWGQPFAMHRRELTALSTAARTRVHISLRLAARRASDTKDSKPHGSSSRARRSGERYDTCVVGFAAFASTAGGIHTTHAERRATRQSSSARTANATTPQVYPLLRRSSARPRSRPRARRGGFEERRLELTDSGRQKMSLNLTWSRRRRRRRPMSPRRRYHDQVRVYAPREGAAAVPRRRRL